MLISRISSRISSGTVGRPPRGRDFQRQYRRDANGSPSQVSKSPEPLEYLAPTDTAQQISTLAGKRMAMREVVKWIIKREAWLEKNAPKSSQRKITHDTAHDPDNADTALLLLGITTRNPGRAEICGRAQLLLEPWAVQAALRRRRGGQRLTDKECDEIRRCTRDRWPRGTGE